MNIEEDGIMVTLYLYSLRVRREAEIWGVCFSGLDPARMDHQERMMVYAVCKWIWSKRLV